MSELLYHDGDVQLGGRIVMDEDLAAASHPNGGGDPKQGFGEMRATVSAGTAAHYHTRCPRILFLALVSPESPTPPHCRLPQRPCTL